MWPSYCLTGDGHWTTIHEHRTWWLPDPKNIGNHPNKWLRPTMWPWHRLTDGGQPLDPKTIGQQSKAVLIFKRKHYHRIVSNIWPSLWSKQKEICKLSSSRKNRQVKIQKKLTKMTSHKLNGRADQEKDRQLEKERCKEILWGHSL